jgi:hypothetical protein
MILDFRAGRRVSRKLAERANSMLFAAGGSENPDET